MIYDNDKAVEVIRQFIKKREKRSYYIVQIDR